MIQDSATIEIDGGREIFGMNMVGRHRGHATIPRTPSNDGLQHKRLLQVDHICPAERSINLAPIRPSEGIALRGNQRRDKRNAKMRERIVRGTDTTIVTIERRRRQHTHIVPSLTQQCDGATRRSGKPITAHVEVINDEQDSELHDYPLRKRYTIRLGAPQSLWTRFFTPNKMDYHTAHHACQESSY